MSSEDDEPNNVDRKLWDEKAKKYARKGQDVVEVCRVKWRQEKVRVVIERHLDVSNVIILAEQNVLRT